MRPTSFSFNISPSGEEVEYDQIVAFAPYMHFETQSNFNDMSAFINKVLQTGAKKLESKLKADTVDTADPSDPAQWSAADSKTLYNHLIRGYLTPKLPDTGERDKDQVVYRYTRDVMYSQDPKLFMVDQLWIWVIDQDTIISCAPTSIGEIAMDDISIRHGPQNRAYPTNSQGIRGSHVVRGHHGTVRAPRPKHRTRQWVHFLSFAPPTESGRPLRENQVWPGDEEERDYQNEYDSVRINHRPLNIRHNISRYLRRATRAQIKSPHELANLIVNHCANVFADHDIPAEYQFFDFFERSIGRVSDRVAHLLKLFQRAAHANFHDVEPQLNIQEEAKLLVEIEDIHDELIILRMVLKDQETVATEIDRFLDPPGSDPNQQQKPYAKVVSAKENRLLKSHLQRIDNMEKMTQRTVKSLRSLLDLKQKQASISEALASVSYAKKSVEQAEETARQGRTLTLFTVVTIVFLPLSFLAAFFAINIDVFPVDANGKLGLDYVLKYLLGISAGLSIPFIFIAFNQDRFAGWVALIRRHVGASLIVATFLLLAVLLIVVLTSSLDSMVKVGAAVGIALFGLFAVIAIGIHRLVHVTRTDNLAQTTTHSSSVVAD
ncbi:hypothetical protein EV127DRAFT_447236 [Xylaria flabelliformis]|nr:hypothetical protein EV127DRAFT_447236 [Xylaria flabelliformis]